jgi:hypothetical protein
VVENRAECARLSRVLETARKAARHTQGLRRRKLG